MALRDRKGHSLDSCVVWGPSSRAPSPPSEVGVCVCVCAGLVAQYDTVHESPGKPGSAVTGKQCPLLHVYHTCTVRSVQCAPARCIHRVRVTERGCGHHCSLLAPSQAELMEVCHAVPDAPPLPHSLSACPWVSQGANPAVSS